MSEFDILVSSMETPDTLTRRSTWLSQRALEWKSSTTSLGRRSRFPRWTQCDRVLRSMLTQLDLLKSLSLRDARRGPSRLLT